MRGVKEIDIYVDGEKIIEGLTLNYEAFDMQSEEPQELFSLQYLPYRAEGAAVDRGDSQLMQGIDVRLGRITFVASQPVTRVMHVQLHHFPIAGHLGQDGGCTDSRHLAVTFDHELTTTGEPGASVAVNQGIQGVSELETLI